MNKCGLLEVVCGKEISIGVSVNDSMIMNVPGFIPNIINDSLIGDGYEIYIPDDITIECIDEDSFVILTNGVEINIDII